MGWGGFLAGVGKGMEDVANNWMREEMEAIRAQRLEEAAMRKDQRQFARDDIVYDRKREDTLEDREYELEEYKKKKDIDLDYRNRAGIGSGGGGSDRYQVMTMEDGSQRLVNKDDLKKMHESGQGLGFTDDSGKFTRGFLGSTTRGSASQPNTFESARKLRADLVSDYGPDGPPADSPDRDLWDNAVEMLRGSRSTQTRGIEPPKTEQTQGKVETKSFIVKKLSRDEAVKLEGEGYRLQRNPATGEYRIYKP